MFLPKKLKFIDVLSTVCPKVTQIWMVIFQGMPKYAKPIRGPGGSSSRGRRFSHFTQHHASTSIENISKAGSAGAGGETASAKDENSSEDELMLGRLPRGSIGSAGPIYVTGGSTIIGGPIGINRHQLMRGESEATDEDDAASIPSAK